VKGASTPAFARNRIMDARGGMGGEQLVCCGQATQCAEGILFMLEN
jgi:hypothetical protein